MKKPSDKAPHASVLPNRRRPICACWLLAVATCLLTSCASFQAQFDKSFLNGPLMRLAANPDETVPDFPWADYNSETEFQLGTAGAPGGGGGGCPT